MYIPKVSYQKCFSTNRNCYSEFEFSLPIWIQSRNLNSVSNLNLFSQFESILHLNLVSQFVSSVQFEFSLTIWIQSHNLYSVWQYEFSLPIHFILRRQLCLGEESVLQAWGKAGAEGEDNGSVVILIGNELPENLLEKTNMRRFWEISEAVFLPQI